MLLLLLIKPLLNFLHIIELVYKVGKSKIRQTLLFLQHLQLSNLIVNGVVHHLGVVLCRKLGSVLLDDLDHLHFFFYLLDLRL